MKNGLKRHLFVLGAYLVLTLLMTLPLVWQFTDHLAGTGGDPWQTLWRFEDKAQYLETSIQQGTIWPFLQTEFLGGGEARLINLSIWPWMPLHYIFGQPIAYNLVWWLSFILAGYGMYLLVRFLLTEHQYPATTPVPWWRVDVAAFLAGLIYMFLPFHVAHARGHFGAMQTQWIPLTMWAFLRWIQKPSWLRSLPVVCFLIIQAVSEHHYLLWLSISFIVYALWYRTRTIRSFKKSISSVVIFLVVLGAIILFYWPTIRLSVQPNNNLALGVAQTIRFSADLFSFITPPAFHTIWGSLSNFIFAQSFTGNISEATHYVGILSILLILFFHQRIPKQQKWFWVLLGIIFTLISLGPRLHVFGQVLSIPLPYALIDSLPVFSAVRAIARASIIVGVSTAVLVGWVVYTQLNRVSSAILVGSIVLLEFLFIPIALQSATMPTVYNTIKNLPGSTLVEIPAATNYVTASQALYASTIHHKKVLANTALERALESDEYADIKQIPGLKQLLFLRTTDLAEARAEFFGQDTAESFFDAVKWLDISAILIHPDSLSSHQLSLVQAFLEDRLKLASQTVDDTLLYLPTTGSQKSDGLLAVRGEGWDQVIFDRAKNRTIASVSHQAEMNLINTTDQPQNIELSWELAPESTGQLIIKYDHTDYTTNALRLTVPPGKSTLQFTNTMTGAVILQNPALQVSP